MVLCDVLCVALLVGLYRNGRGLRTLVLATAFAWSAIIVVTLACAVPGSSPSSRGWAWAAAPAGRTSRATSGHRS